MHCAEYRNLIEVISQKIQSQYVSGEAGTGRDCQIPGVRPRGRDLAVKLSFWSISNKMPRNLGLRTTKGNTARNQQNQPGQCHCQGRRRARPQPRSIPCRASWACRRKKGTQEHATAVVDDERGYERNVRTRKTPLLPLCPLPPLLPRPLPPCNPLVISQRQGAIDSGVKSKEPPSRAPPPSALPPFSSPLSSSSFNFTDGGVVDAIAPNQRRHHQVRSQGSHVTDRGCHTLRSQSIKQLLWPRPRERCLQSPKSVVRLAHLSLARPNHHRRRGLCTVVEGSSPAPWQPSYGREGATPGAGVPCDVGHSRRRIPRVRSWKALSFFLTVQQQENQR